MQQILAGVQTQMEKMHEEEILVKIGEKTREASNSKLIDKTKRDSNIDGWLQKRQSQSSGLGLGASGSGTPSLAGSKPNSPPRLRPGVTVRVRPYVLAKFLPSPVNCPQNHVGRTLWFPRCA